MYLIGGRSELLFLILTGNRNVGITCRFRCYDRRFCSGEFMSDPSNVAINPDTIEQLATYGIDALMVN
jgi:hypothetical protein